MVAEKKSRKLTGMSIVNIMNVARLLTDTPEGTMIMAIGIMSLEENIEVRAARHTQTDTSIDTIIVMTTSAREGTTTTTRPERIEHLAKVGGAKNTGSINRATEVPIQRLPGMEAMVDTLSRSSNPAAAAVLFTAMTTGMKDTAIRVPGSE